MMLTETAKSEVKDATIEMIINAVAKEFHYPRESLLVGSKREDLVELRAVVAMAAFLLGIPIVRISRVLGYKSHASVYNLLAKTDARIKREAEKIVKLVTGT